MKARKSVRVRVKSAIRATVVASAAILCASAASCEGRFLDREEVAALYGGGNVWCFWPDDRKRCLWAETASEPRRDAFSAKIFAHQDTYVSGDRILKRVSVSRNALKYRKDRLCEDKSRPLAQGDLEFYEDPEGLVRRDAQTRPSTAAEFADYLTQIESGGREVCFLYARGGIESIGLLYLQYVVVDGVVQDEPDEFLVFSSREKVRLEAN